MIGGRAGNVIAVRPLRQGVMTEYEITAQMLALVLKRVGVSKVAKPRVLVSVPSSSSEVERRAVEEAVKHAGGRGVVLVEEISLPFAANSCAYQSPSRCARA